MKRLACVRNQETAPLGIIEPVLEGSGIEWGYLDAWSEPGVPAISDISGLIVLGGEMNADDIDGYPFLRSVRSLTRAAVEEEVPILGVCLGAQILTRALDAEVRVAPVREIGFLPVKATAAGMDDPVMLWFAPHSDVFQFHEDECDLPPGAELLFEGTDVPVQAFRVGPNAYGIQFHFEVTQEIIETWCREVPDLEESWGKSRDQVLTEARPRLATQQEAGRRATTAFLELLR